MSLSYDINIKNDEVTLLFKGNLLGAESSDKLFIDVEETISKGLLVCIVDLKGVKYMDSSGLGVLIRILTKFRNIGGEVYLSNVSEQVKKLLLITKLNSIFELK